ncbi:hypothetical protein U9M48_014215 [Paspalum notatum var. saurae]|uniref:Reverse transcriptase Ty1/copia-type domain-containing protein n=1 Tax=Paspalum notatum var. saurae TaxID=547442 RepID=A0AAQ3WKB1_PASNO
MWSWASGFSSTSSTPMGRLPATKLARWSTISHTAAGIDYDEIFSLWSRWPRSTSSSARAWPIHHSPPASSTSLHLTASIYCSNLGCDTSNSLRTCGTSALLLRLFDSSLFLYKDQDSVVYLLLYVDEIILTASSSTLLQHVTDRPHAEFAMTDLGDLHHFLGISITRSVDGLFLSQRQYASDLLQRASMAKCHSTSTPVDTRAKLSATNGAPVANPTEYQSLARVLQHLTMTRP